jgi:recombination protein RecA
VVKNKVAPPFRVAEFDIMFDQGISKEGELVELGAEHDVLKKSGSFYSFGETKLGQGKENVKIFLKDNPDIALQIEALIKAAVEPAPEQPPEDQAEEALAIVGVEEGD